MAKVKVELTYVGDAHTNVPYGYRFKCPGCECSHVVAVQMAQSNGARWDFSGTLDNPTISPSILVKSGKYIDPNFDDEGIESLSSICHSFVKNGNIQFLGDCTHKLKGQTVPLPDIE